MPKILLTGVSGQVGYELYQTLSPLAEVLPIDIRDVDFSDAGALEDFVRKSGKIDLVVNPAAYTAVDPAEDHPETARSINVDAPAVLARETARRGIPMIHYSTDYVFDGSLPPDRLYGESDTPNPLSVYGRTKWDGERAVRESNEKHCVFRLCWVYGTRGRNFLLTMLRLHREGRTPDVVDDQFGAPTWSRQIASATALVVGRMFASPGDFPWGTYHLSASGTACWHEFATEIFSEMNRRTARNVEMPRGISSSEYPVKALRPKNSRLDNTRLAMAFGLRLPDWKRQLSWCLDAITENGDTGR